MPNNRKKTGNGALTMFVCIFIAATIALTTFGQPGFFYMLTAKSPVELNESVEYSNFQGHSRAFTQQVDSRFTISAPENALDKDRTFNVSEISNEEYRTLDEMMLNNGVLLSLAYHINSGLAEDESFPGTFQMDFNLNELGIPNEMKEDICVYRLSDSGDQIDSLYTELNGPLLTCHSRKNCVVLLGAVVFSSAFFSADLERAYSEKWRDMDTEHVLSTRICNGKVNLYWESNDVKSIVDQIKSRENEITNEIKNQLINDNPYAMNGFAFQSARNDAIAKDSLHNELKAKLEDKKSNAVSTTVMKGIISVIEAGYRYLTIEQRIQEKDVVIDILISPSCTDGALGEAINPLSCSPYIKLPKKKLDTSSNTPMNESVKDDLILTITHEMLHVLQTGYTTVDWSSDSIFWEATAMLLERDALEYFRNSANDVRITTSQILTDMNNFETLSYPMGTMPNDNYAAIYNGYTLGGFLLKMRASGYDLPLDRLLSNYREERDFVKTVMKTTRCTGNAMSAAYTKFVLDNSSSALNAHKGAKRGESHRVKEALKDDVLFSSSNMSEHITLNDSPLSSYYREFVVDGTVGQHAFYIRPDDTLYKLPGYQIVTGVKKLTAGYFIPTTNERSSYMYEMFSNTIESNGSSGYTVWMLTAPTNPVGEIIDAKTLLVTLPNTSEAGRDGAIDGYRLRITSSDGKKSCAYIPRSKWGGKIKFKLSDLAFEVTENLTFTITASEYIGTSKKGRVYGPESSQLSTNTLDAELIAAGAGQGTITVSMLWGSTDDLDLHVITPDGSEIYYGNKKAQGGELDVDRQATDYVDNPIENIFFESPTSGKYKVFVVNYCDRTEDYASAFIVRITVNGQYKNYNGSLNGDGNSFTIDTIDFTEKDENYDNIEIESY